MDRLPTQSLAGRGAILLLEDSPAHRTRRAESLMGRGFAVETAESIDHAESLWIPGRYIVVLVAVQRDLARAVEFCDRIKGEYPQQTVGMLVRSDQELPPTRCPDLLWPEETLERFLARVETLADFSRAA